MFKPAPGQTEGRRTGDFEARTVQIADGRHLAEHFSLDREGFELSRHATAVSDFLDDDEVRSIYYPEVERLVRDATGASQVVIFDHTVRIDDVQKSLANDTHARCVPKLGRSKFEMNSAIYLAAGGSLIGRTLVSCAAGVDWVGSIAATWRKYRLLGLPCLPK